MMRRGGEEGKGEVQEQTADLAAVLLVLTPGLF